MTAEELRAILDLHHSDDPIQVRIAGLNYDVEGYSTYGYRQNGILHEVLTLEVNYYGEPPSRTD